MTKRHLSGVLAWVSLAAVSGCSAETPDRCVERFGKRLADGHPTRSADLRDARFQPIFTYDVTQMENVLEEFVGEGDELAGMRMTISHGASGAAMEAFYKDEVPPKGAAFAADDFSLFRVRGTPGSRDQTLVNGCRKTPPKARLVHIHWIALPSTTEDLARTH